MSCQKGSSSRNRPQKHQNRTSFKNTLHDTSHRTKTINSLQVGGVCARCKEVIEWKIKFKKYKPLTQPKKCVKCEQKTVRHAYHVMCLECGKNFQSCTKCLQTKELIAPPVDKSEQVRMDAEMKRLLQSLPERKRRTFLRYMNRKDKDENGEEVGQERSKDELMAKLDSLKVGDEEEDSDFDLGDSDDDLDLGD